MNQKPALRIVGVDPELAFAGGESQVLGLTRELIRQGACADLLCDPDGELWDRAQAAGVRCFPMRIRNALDIAAGIRLRRFLRATPYDVVHFHTARAHALAPWARRCGPATIVTRRMDYRPNRLFAPWLFHRAVDRVVAISSAVAEAMVGSGVDRARIKIIPSGVDTDRFRPPSDGEREKARAAWGIGPQSIAIGAVGQLTERKGHRHLIEAIYELRDSLSHPIRCVIAGAGPLADNLKAQSAALGLENVVTIAGPMLDPLALFWALDVFAMPSLREGLGVALLEAMACGLACVASRSGGIAEAIEDGRSGLLAQPASAPELAGQLRRLINEPQVRSQIGAQARMRAVNRFSLKAMAQSIMELYRASLSG
ncbi:MAG TPA: glycosyltransferase family 4 protein [Candidatus Binataceae bacterium]